MQAFIAYYSGFVKILPIFLFRNNIVNALTQYVYPLVIPPNPTRNAAKVGRIFGIPIKNEKKFQKKMGMGIKKEAHSPEEASH